MLQKSSGNGDSKPYIKEKDKELKEAVDLVFDAYDTNRNGKLQMREVISLINDSLFCMQQKRKVSKAELEKFLTKSDKDNDGEIDRDELYLFFEKMLE